ncbi:hypothetical protein GBS0709_23650 [Edwardsiella tarda]|nr:hypothetical protein GBS0709_23650 [Edwardsiella tarda]
MLGGIFQCTKRTLSSGKKDFAAGSKRYALGAALTDPALQHRLQEPDLMTHRRRADAQQVSRAFKAVAVGNGVKGAQRP